MDLLDRTFYGNPLSAWLVALTIAIAVFAGARLVVRNLIKGISVLSQRTDTMLDDLMGELLKSTRGFVFLFLALYGAALVLVLPPMLEDLVRKAFILALFLQTALWGSRTITFFVRYYRDRQAAVDPAAATSLSALGFVGRIALWAVILLLALDNLGVDVTALMAGLGIGGVAVALAVQNILGDLFASLSIVLDKPFVLGDFIIVGDLLGTVEHVGLKTTRVRALSGEQLVFSNSDLLESRIRNFKRMYERRILFSFGVLYQTPHEMLARIPGMVREIIEARENARFDRAHFKRFGDSSLDFEVVYYVQVPDYTVYMDTQQAINLAIVRRFEEEAIEFAYPTRTLYVNMESKPAELAAGGAA